MSALLIQPVSGQEMHNPGCSGRTVGLGPQENTGSTDAAPVLDLGLMLPTQL